MINLILNAYDAIGEGGDVTLATAFRDGKVVISVRDNGPGIPAARLSRSWTAMISASTRYF